VTAKDLTQEDHLRLNGYVEKYITKGTYSQNELLRDVRDLIKASVRVTDARRGAARGSTTTVQG
ncbi:MAG: hypothetical protein WKH64_04115, partial [Chloroflexia bacterium]